MTLPNIRLFCDCAYNAFNFIFCKISFIEPKIIVGVVYQKNMTALFLLFASVPVGEAAGNMAHIVTIHIDILAIEITQILFNMLTFAIMITVGDDVRRMNTTDDLTVFYNGKFTGSFLNKCIALGHREIVNEYLRNSGIGRDSLFRGIAAKKEKGKNDKKTDQI